MILYSLGIILALIAYMYQQWNFIGGYGIGGKVTTNLNNTYDYIVVGAGSAGAVVASRLSENPDVTVLLLESGGEETNYPALNIPVFADTPDAMAVDWGFHIPRQTQYGKARNNGANDCARAGRVLGGSSFVNHMQYTRGSKYDYMSWKEGGCVNWDYKDVLPFFLKSEDFQMQDGSEKVTDFHSKGGFLGVTKHTGHPTAELFLQAGKELGFKTVDINSDTNIGFSDFYSSTRNGIRSSTSREILRNAMLRENLHVAVNSLVTKVSIENRKASGIEVIKDNRKEKIRARNEVIVSAGGIGSPKLLMLSGIGPKDHLNDFNINVVADLPVGKNSENHMLLPLWTNINITSSSIFDNEYIGYLRYLLFQTGMFASPTAEAVALFRKDGKKDGKPDFQLNFMPIKFPGVVATGDSSMSYIDQGPGLTFLLFHLNHKSPGEVKLQSSDPFDAPNIDPKHFTNENDMLELIEGVRFVEKLMKTAALKQMNVSMDINKIPMCKHEVFNSDKYWKCFISYVAMGAYINSGTCRMGAVSSPSTVVDSRLRVKGITGLRVADASIMPRIISGGTNAATIMIAERAVEFIKEDRQTKK